MIVVSVADQRLDLLRGDEVARSFRISTSRFGLGTKDGSRKTPTGYFRIVEKIGAGLPFDTIFKSRRPLPSKTKPAPGDDAIMSRIFWLDGLGKRNANTRSRYIYIHGTNHPRALGRPASHGCVRMRNSEVAELFELAPVGTLVRIRR